MSKLTRFVKIGNVSVDAGLIWIGDPCYIWEDSASAKQDIGKTWNDFCESLQTDQYPVLKSYDGLGVVVTSGYGDGSYPVYATIEDGVVKSVTIQFDESGDEEEERSDEESRSIDEAAYEEDETDGYGQAEYECGPDNGYRFPKW